MADDDLDFDPAKLEQEAPATHPPSTALQRGIPKHVHETGWDDDTVKTEDIELYKGRKNVTDRITVLGRPFWVRTHYAKETGHIVCTSDYDENDLVVRSAACCEVMEPSRRRFGALVLQYHTDNKGQLIKPFGFTLRLWRFSDDKYVALRNINGEFPLAEHDMLVSCDDEGYQRMAFTACREAIAKRPDFQEKFGPAVKNWQEKVMARAIKSLGKMATAQELLAKLGRTVSAASAADSPVLDLKDIL